ncbi:MAG: DUF4174 domain-containing protein [Desulfobacterales bacterium]
MALLVAQWAFDLRDSISMNLEQFKWEKRLLFIFAPDRFHPDLKEIQAEISTQKSAVEDRDLVVFKIAGNASSQKTTPSLSQADADALRKHFGVDPNTYTLILIGKDGGIKLKRDDRVPLSEIFELIDSMPMRRYEMRQKNQ